MSNNRVSAHICANDRQEVMQAIATIRQKLPFVVDLSPEERRSMSKMGDKNQAFARKALEIATQNPDFLPRSFNIEGNRSHPPLRGAIAISGAVGQKATKIGQWILTDLRDLIEAIAQKQANSPPFIGSILRRLCRACHLGEKVEHPKLRALAREILNDWDAVVAFVNHPELPPTNNEAERALRHAVIARRLGYGTRTSEGSLAYSSLLSVIETCRLRNIDPWTYLAEVIALARRGISPPPVPAGNVN